jgi:hypothetical protein
MEDDGRAGRLAPAQAAALRAVVMYIVRRRAYPRAAQLGVRSAVLVGLWRRGLLDRGGWTFPVYAPTAAGWTALRRWRVVNDPLRRDESALR